MADEVETPADQLRISQIQIRNLPPDNKDVLEAVLLRGEENAVVCRIPLSRGTSAFCGACSSKALTVGLDLSALAESTAALKVAIRAVPKEPEEPPAEGEEPPPPAAALGTVPIGISPQLEKGLVEGPVLVTFEPDAPAPAAVVEEAKKPAGKPAKGGKGAKEAPKEAAAEAPPPPKRDTTVEVAGWWRLEAPLPDIASTNRIIPLAMRYTGPAARQSVLERQAIWRSEMARELSLDPPAYGASHRFALAAPLKPSHTFGDAPSRAVRLDYVKTMNSLRVTLGEQAEQRQLDLIFKRLHGCVTAEQAAAALHEMQAFLRRGATLTKVDAEDAAARLGRVRLPFERLVRNVWMAGPEVAYDTAKASLGALLEKEVASRRKEAERAAKQPNEHFFPRQRVPQYAHNLAEQPHIK